MTDSATIEGLEERRGAYLQALLARDSARARRTVEQAVDDGVPIPEVYLEVLQPALQTVGHMWAVGELNVAEEHYATAMTQSLLGALGARMRVPPKDGRLAVVATTPREQHVLGPQMVADFLEADGWEVLNLGGSPPAPDLAELVDAERPEVVALSTSTAGSLPGVAAVLDALAALPARPFIVVGGLLWTAEAARDAPALGADLVEHDPRRLVAALRERFPPDPEEA